MAISETKSKLSKLVLLDDAKVITISGLWGTGKTYLWNEIKENSQSDKVKNAKYVSLYGLNDIKSMKEALLRNILGHDKHGSNSRKKVWKIAGYVTNITSQLIKGVPAILDFSDIALPFYLENSFVVIDDIERFDKDLDVRQLMGFINEYTSQYQTRFILIMNKKEMSEDNIEKWDLMNEKIVDFEISHTISPTEAFDIAAEGHNIEHREELKKSIEVLNVQNIRVIKKILNLSAKILGGHKLLREGALSRIIPCIVLTGSVYYKEIKCWKKMEDYLGYMDAVTTGTFDIGFYSRKNNEPHENKEAAEIIRSLGLININGLTSGVVRVIESSLTEIYELHETIKNLSLSEAKHIAQNNYLRFLNNYYWDFKKNIKTIQQEADELLKDVQFLNPKEISELLDFMHNKEIFKNHKIAFLQKWIEHNGGKRNSYSDIELKTSNGEDIRADIINEVNVKKEEDKENYGVRDAIMHIYENRSWGEKESSVFRYSTEVSITEEIYAMSGEELRKFIAHVTFISDSNFINEPSFSGISYKLRKAADIIISKNKHPRLSIVLQEHINRFAPIQAGSKENEESDSEVNAVNNSV